jgi:hypothetical protein
LILVLCVAASSGAGATVDDTKSAVVELQIPLREGARSVSGHVSPVLKKPTEAKEAARTDNSAKTAGQSPASPEAAQKKRTVVVIVRPPQDRKSDPTTTAVFYQRVVANVDKDTAIFAAQFPQPLMAGQVVEVEVFDGDTPVSTPYQYPVATSGDWGRVHAYFTGGVVFSNDAEDFSRQDLVLSFTLDKNWWQAADPYALEKSGRERGASGQNPSRGQPCEGGERRKGGNACEGGPSGRLSFRQLNTFFDTRLTAVPVVPQATAAAPPSTAAKTGATTSSSSTAAGFVDSRKAATIQVGIYAPLYSDAWAWTHDHQRNALFVAPVAKFGISTIVGQDQGKATDTSVYKFWSFGVGLGHYRLNQTPDTAPELISYLHVTAGKWESFGTEWRLAVEGRLKLPDAPFQVGFDANVRRGFKGDADLRFVVGTRFDLGELLGKLKSFGM